MESGVEKRFLMSHLDKLTIVGDVPREGREGRFFERLSKPRPTECEVCGKELTDLVSIAIGTGLTCRSPMLDAQRAQQNEQLLAFFEKILGDDRAAASVAMDEHRTDEEAARFLIWIYDLDV